jgi:hypothetical protein
MRFVVQFDDGDNLAASGANNVIHPLLGNPQSVAMRDLLVAARRVEQGRHGNLRKNVVLGKRNDEPAEKLRLVIGHKLVLFVRSGSAFAFRILQQRYDEACCQYDEYEEKRDFHVSEFN